MVLPNKYFFKYQEIYAQEKEREMNVKVVTNKSMRPEAQDAQSPSQGNDWEATRARERPSWMVLFGLSRCMGLCSISEEYSLHLDCSVMDVFVQPGNQTVAEVDPT